MKKMKKTACMLLALVMLFGVCPFAAFAQETEETLVVGGSQTEAAAAAATYESAPVTDTAAQSASVAETQQVQSTAAEATAEQPAHVHNYVVAGSVPATCSAKGYITYACACGDSYVSLLPVNPDAHEYENNICKYCGKENPATADAAAAASETVTTEEAVTSEETQTTTDTTTTEETANSTTNENEVAAVSEEVEEEPVLTSGLTATYGETESGSSSSGGTSEVESSIKFSFDTAKLQLLIEGSGDAELEGKTTEFSSEKTDIETALEGMEVKESSVLSVVVDGIKKIGQFAFTGLKNLQVVFIGEDTEEIESGAFAGTTELDAIIVDSDNENYADEFGVLYSKDKTELVAVPADKDGAIPVNPNVTTVDDYAFAYSDLSDAYFLGNAPEFESADGNVKHTFEGTGTTIRHACWNYTWYNPYWVYDTFIETPMVASWTSIAAYHYPYVSKSGTKPTETEFGLTDELRCRVCGAIVQSQTKIWPNGKEDTGTYSFNSITSVPSSLANNDKYNTVEKLKAALKEEVAAEYKTKTDKTMPDANYKAYDITLVSGTAKDGQYIVTIPYPTGIGPEHYDFVCVHLNNNGNMEKLDVFETNRGLQVTVSDLSPFGFAWYYNDVDP